MHFFRTVRVASAATLLLAVGLSAFAQDSGRKTFLQRVQGRRDARINSNGNNPQRERQPPLKKIADPSFLDPGDDPLAKIAADNPAIKNAAEIKAQEDLKKQKIKAIKYLGEVGCGCYPGVKEALMAALDDCTEEVRYEAALALCRASGNHCTACNPGSCCDADVMNKLADKAHAKDGNGCWKEQSQRVRAAALSALNACRRVQPPRPATDKEVPKEVPIRELPGGTEIPAEQTSYQIRNPIQLDALGQERVMQAAAIVIAASDCPHGCPNGCPPGGHAAGPYPAVEPGTAPGEGVAPYAPEGMGAGETPSPYASPDSLAGSYGAAAGPQSALPYVVGDLGFACGTLRIGGANATLGHPQFGCSRLNLAENGSPLPQDRLAVTWRHFEKAVETDVFSSEFRDNSAMLDVDRITFLMERTMLDGAMSLEVRLPFSNQLSNKIYVAQGQSTPGLSNTDYPDNVTGVPITDTNFVLGNVALALKGLLYQDCYWGISAGVGLNLPTAPDVTITADIEDDNFRFYDSVNPDQYIEVPVNVNMAAMVANETVDLTPFVAFTYTPTERFFTQGFLQLDLPLNNTRGVLGVEGAIGGLPVDFEPENGAGGVAGLRELSWQTLMRLNAQFGYWLYINPDRDALLRRVGGLFEVHYTTTLNNADRIEDIVIIDAEDVALATGDPDAEPLLLTLGHDANRVDIVNLVGGMTFEFRRTEITSAFIMPVTNGDNDPFEWELGVMLNRRF